MTVCKKGRASLLLSKQGSHGQNHPRNLSLSARLQEFKCETISPRLGVFFITAAISVSRPHRPAYGIVSLPSTGMFTLLCWYNRLLNSTGTGTMPRTGRSLPVVIWPADFNKRLTEHQQNGSRPRCQVKTSHFGPTCSRFRHHLSPTGYGFHRSRSINPQPKRSQAQPSLAPPSTWERFHGNGKEYYGAFEYPLVKRRHI